MSKGSSLILLLFLIGCTCTGTEQEVCECSDGFWNTCGSPCAGKASAYCAQYCVAQCECGFEDYKCASGYECYQEEGAERGVCKLIS